MRNIKLTIEYDGTDYAGWQIQRNQKPETSDRRKSRATARENQKIADRKGKRTIQETLEKVLSQMLQEKVRVIASGRTDARVHALGQIANFKTKSKLACKNIRNGLNSILPKDIRAKQIKQVPLDFHARFDARSKVYRYTIVNNSFVSPFLHRYSHLIKYPLDVKKMQKACQYLLGRHNFRSFQAVDKRERHSVRTISRLDVRKANNIIYLDIEADGFLYRMARNIAGTLLEVGRGRLKPEGIKEILKAKNRTSAGPCAPAKGLCLMAVRYKKYKSG